MSLTGLNRNCGPLDLNGAKVIAQLGQSLDGRVAAASGESRYINGPGGLTHLHQLRAAVDAVLVGVGTVLADDPRLTVRHARGASPARVIIDLKQRLPRDAICLAEDEAEIVIIGPRRDLPRLVTFLDVDMVNGVACPSAVLAGLRDHGFERVLVEGGPTTIAHFMRAGVIDMMHLLVAPMIIGAGPIGLDLPHHVRLDQSLKPRTVCRPLAGGDVLFECDFRHGADTRSCDTADSVEADTRLLVMEDKG
ncbi:MAG: RibD family protein [Pseudomonadota bacterium]